MSNITEGQIPHSRQSCSYPRAPNVTWARTRKQIHIIARFVLSNKYYGT